ncbi:hypothetical protein ACHAQF_003626 [Verticillium nonalfalfae]
MAPLVWLITGSSTGFGAEFVKALLAAGDKVIATARNPTSIAHFQKAGASVLKLDLTSSQSDFEQLAEKAIGIHGGVDVVVNNAGYPHFSTIEDDRTLLVEPGYFRTEFLNEKKAVYIDTKIDEYKPLVDNLYPQVKGIHQQQPGDPAKGVARILDVVKSHAAGEDIPVSLALGDDALDTIRKKCTDTLELLDKWAEKSSNTSF